jgi:NitT/TauT family transport system ATP-binding protein
MLDEPFAALDAFTREELWCVLRDMWRRLQFTVVLVTHDLREAAFLADHIHVMSARPGRVIKTKHVAFEKPRDLDVCYTPPFVDLVHELRQDIAEVRTS